MTVKLVLGKDSNSNVTYELPVSNSIANTTLAANVAQSVTIPSGMTRAFFSFSNGTDVYVRFDGVDATLPTGGFTFSPKELNPVARYGLIPGNSMSFISPTTAYVEVAFFPDSE